MTLIDWAESGFIPDWLIRIGIRRLLAARLRQELSRDAGEVNTVNVAEFATERRFDRVLSVEMFEHIRNQEELLRRISTWLQPAGKLMVHIFCHAHYACPFETEGASNCVGRSFFTGGIMPFDNLLVHFQRDLVLVEQWHFSGIHYARTLEAWLANCDRLHRELCRLLQSASAPGGADREL